MHPKYLKCKGLSHGQESNQEHLAGPRREEVRQRNHRDGCVRSLGLVPEEHAEQPGRALDLAATCAHGRSGAAGEVRGGDPEVEREVQRRVRPHHGHRQHPAELGRSQRLQQRHLRQVHRGSDLGPEEGDGGEARSVHANGERAGALIPPKG